MLKSETYATGLVLDVLLTKIEKFLFDFSH